MRRTRHLEGVFAAGHLRDVQKSRLASGRQVSLRMLHLHGRSQSAAKPVFPTQRVLGKAACRKPC